MHADGVGGHRPGLRANLLGARGPLRPRCLEESYFGFDPAFGGRGEHNLLRARGQAALAASVRAQRGEAEAVLARLTGGPS